VPKYYGVVDLNPLDPLASNLISSFEIKDEAEKPIEVPKKDIKELITKDGVSVSKQQKTDKEQWLDNLFRRRFDCKNTSNLNINNIGFIKIQDITATIKHPCVLDIKLGLGKVKPNKKLSIITEHFKFRICGMSVYQVKLGMFLFRDKYWGRKLQVTELKDALKLFFHNGNSTQH